MTKFMMKYSDDKNNEKKNDDDMINNHENGKHEIEKKLKNYEKKLNKAMME
jgi:hypothetical protein